MVRVGVAQLITQRNFYRNALNYMNIVATMQRYVRMFDGAGLQDIAITAPDYSSLPSSADDVIIIPNAWSATYVNHLRQVRITGALYIGS